jgi:hypothetical protein
MSNALTFLGHTWFKLLSLPVAFAFSFAQTGPDIRSTMAAVPPQFSSVYIHAQLLKAARLELLKQA